MRSLISYGFIAPPTLLILLNLVGALVALVWFRIGVAVVLASSVGLFVAATPVFSSYLVVRLEAEIPDDTDLGSAQAIVVLGADVRSGDAALPDALGPMSLQRIAFSIQAYRRLRLPMVVSGGRISDWHTSVAELMKSALEQYGIPIALSEEESRTTFENALYTAQLLRGQNISTVILVTQARDLPRAIWSFERAGLRALPWSAPRDVLRIHRVQDFLPSIGALQDSFYAFHELIGSVYYRLHY